MTSVSVSDLKTCPSRISSSRRAAWFSMIPLWMTAISPLQSQCGWALESVGSPWVAQRVCPSPVVPVSGDWASLASSLAIFPAAYSIPHFSPARRTTPAES